MANIRVEIISDFTKIHCYSNVTVNAAYPVLQIYNGLTLLGNCVFENSKTVGGITYTTSPGFIDLDFQVLSNGEYHFELIPTSINSTEEKFADGVYTFIFLADSNIPNITKGTVAYYDKLCCMSTKLTNAYFTQNSDIISKAENNILTVSALLESTKASVRIDDFVNAIDKFKVTTLICENCECS